jgi:hypothetical protein
MVINMLPLLNTFLSLYVTVTQCECVCVCVHVYIYIYIYTHTHTYIHICVSQGSQKRKATVYFLAHLCICRAVARLVLF